MSETKKQILLENPKTLTSQAMPSFEPIYNAPRECKVQVAWNLTGCSGRVSMPDRDIMSVLITFCTQSSQLTWVKCLHVAVKKTDVHASHVDNVEQGCDDHAPHCQEHPDQNIDCKQQVRQQEQTTPVKQKEALKDNDDQWADSKNMKEMNTTTVTHLLSRSCVPAVFLMKQNLPRICWINTARRIISQKGLKGRKSTIKHLLQW